jgi:hypothetical protein
MLIQVSHRASESESEIATIIECKKVVTAGGNPLWATTATRGTFGERALRKLSSCDHKSSMVSKTPCRLGNLEITCSLQDSSNFPCYGTSARALHRLPDLNRR